MIAGKPPPPSKFHGNRERLEGGLLQVTGYFTITGTRNAHQRLAFVALYMEGKALDWWKADKDKYSSFAEVQTGIGLYYGTITVQIGCKWVVWEVLSKGELLPHEVILRGY